MYSRRTRLHVDATVYTEVHWATSTTCTGYTALYWR